MTKDAITRRVALDQCDSLMKVAATLRARIRTLTARNLQLETALAKARTKPKAKPRTLRRDKRKAVRK